MRSTFAFSKTLAVLLLIPTLAFGANRPGSNATNSFYVGLSTQASTNPVMVAGLTTAPITPLVERTWDGLFDWQRLCAARPTHSDQSDCTWTTLITKMNTVNGYGGRLIYTMGQLPQWATGSTFATCHAGASWLGSCNPPTDVLTACTAQGSLSGQTFSDNCMVREFVNDLLTKATANGTPIWAIELGNEPNFCGNSDALCDSTSFPSSGDPEWIGSMAQLVAFDKAIATQARATQPGIILMGPSTTSFGTAGTCGTNQSGEAFMNKWLGLYNGPALDYVTVHIYSGTTPEGADTRITTIKACANLSSSAQLFTTEGGWGNVRLNGCGINSVTRVTNVNTYTCSGGHFLTGGDVGANIQIGGTKTGVNATSFDGTFAIASVPNSTTFTVAQVAIDDNTSAGGQGNAVLTAQLALQPDYLSRWFLIQFSRGVKGAVWYSAYNNNWGTLCQKFNASVCQDATVSPARVTIGEMYKWLADATASGTCSTNGTVWTCNYTKADGYTSQAVWDTSGASTYTFPAGYTQYRDTTGATNLLSGTTQAIGTTPILLEKIPRNGGGGRF